MPPTRQRGTVVCNEPHRREIKMQTKAQRRGREPDRQLWERRTTAYRAATGVVTNPVPGDERTYRSGAPGDRGAGPVRRAPGLPGRSLRRSDLSLHLAGGVLAPGGRTAPRPRPALPPDEPADAQRASGVGRELSSQSRRLDRTVADRHRGLARLRAGCLSGVAHLVRLDDLRLLALSELRGVSNSGRARRFARLGCPNSWSAPRTPTSTTSPCGRVTWRAPFRWASTAGHRSSISPVSPTSARC